MRDQLSPHRGFPHLRRREFLALLFGKRDVSRVWDLPWSHPQKAHPRGWSNAGNPLLEVEELLPCSSQSCWDVGSSLASQGTQHPRTSGGSGETQLQGFLHHCPATSGLSPAASGNPAPQIRGILLPGSGNAVPNLLSAWTLLCPLSLVLETHRNVSSGAWRTQLPPCWHRRWFLGSEVAQVIPAHSPNPSSCRRTGISLTPSKAPQPGGAVTSPSSHLKLSLLSKTGSAKEQTPSPPSISAPGCPQGARICHRDVAVPVQTPVPCAVGSEVGLDVHAAPLETDLHSV